ncbi:MAG: hypothetical protein Kow0065_19780 [Methylomicrobium sp.]
MKALAEFVLQGPIQALVVASVLGALSQFILPLALFCGGVIALCVLSRSSIYWTIVVVGTVAAVYISSLFAEGRPGLSFPVVLFLIVPVVLSSLILRSTESQSWSIGFAAVVAASLAIAMRLVTGDVVQWWSDWLEIAVTGVKDAHYQGFESGGPLTMMNGLIAMLLGYATVLSVFIGRWMQALAYNPGGFAKEFYRVRYSVNTLVALGVVLIVVAVLSVEASYDLLLIFSMLFFFSGLAVLHSTVERTGKGNSYVWPIYIMLTIFPPFTVVGIALLGLADIFFKFRKAV